MENIKLLFIKKGDFKSGFFSKKNASEFSFYSDRIIVKTLGWSRLFNSADIVIHKQDILNIKESFRVFGYNIIVETKSGEFTLSFNGDKLLIKQILNEHFQFCS